jgi:hypothetical protein
MDADPAADRPPWQRTYVIAMAAIIGGLIGYGLCDWGGWTRLQHDPYTGAWWWQSGPSQRIPINYYGNLLWGVGGGAVGALFGSVAMRLHRRRVPPAVINLLGAWALTAFALAGLYYVWTLWPF